MTPRAVDLAQLVPMRVFFLYAPVCHSGCDGVGCRAEVMRRGNIWLAAYGCMKPLSLGMN